MCTTVVRAIPQVESFLRDEFLAFDLRRTLFESPPPLTMIFLLLLLEVSDLRRVLTLVEIVKEEFIHFGLRDSKVLQFVVQTELVLCSFLYFFTFLLEFLDSLILILL